MRKFIVSLAALAFLAAPSFGKGPIRQWIHDHRPGILIPKETLVVVIEPTPAPQVVWNTPVYYTPCPTCPNGQCPIK